MRRFGAFAGAVGSIAVLTLVARLLGFVRTWVQNGALGDTLIGEAYSTANTVPNVLFEVAAGGALAGTVIPLISSFLAKRMSREVDRTASALLTWIFVISLPLVAVVLAAAAPITRALLGAGTDPDELAAAAALLRMFALQVPLYGASVVFAGVLQAHRKFTLPALAPMLSSLVVIGAFTIFAHLAGGNQNEPGLLTASAMAVLGWGTTLGVVAFVVPQAIPVFRLVRIRPTLRFPDGVARRAAKLAGAGLGGLLAQQIQILVVMVVANTRGGTGSYPVFTFANAVYMVPYAVLAVPIATAVFPRVSQAAALDDREDLLTVTARSTRLVTNVGITCAVLLAVLATPANIVFDVLRPAAGMDVAMVCMAPGLVGYALIYHGSRVLYAVEASRAVAAANATAWLTVCVVLIVECAAGFEGRIETLTAIGIAMSVGMSVAALMQIRALRVHVGHDAVAGLARSAGLVTCSMLPIGGLAWVVQHAVIGFLAETFVGAMCAAILSAGMIIGGGVGAMRAIDPASFKVTERTS